MATVARRRSTVFLMTSLLVSASIIIWSVFFAISRSRKNSRFSSRAHIQPLLTDLSDTTSPCRTRPTIRWLWLVFLSQLLCVAIQHCKQLSINVSRLSSFSFELNSVQRRIQQLACVDSLSSTTETGGWCNRAVAVEHRTDQGLARAMADLLSGSRVVGLGDGLGQYRRLLLEMTSLDRYDAYDGSPFVEQLTDGQVGFFDLALPQFWLPAYDWTVCLEVLEHVPEKYESTAVGNVVRPARVGVVLSWARPGQGGLGHVNTRSQQYVDELMNERGFELDVLASTRLRDAATFAWFKFTLNVYRRTNESIDLFDYLLTTTGS